MPSINNRPPQQPHAAEPSSPVTPSPSPHEAQPSSSPVPTADVGTRSSTAPTAAQSGTLPVKAERASGLAAKAAVQGSTPIGQTVAAGPAAQTTAPASTAPATQAWFDLLSKSSRVREPEAFAMQCLDQALQLSPQELEKAPQAAVDMLFARLAGSESLSDELLSKLFQVAEHLQASPVFPQLATQVAALAVKAEQPPPVFKLAALSARLVPQEA